MIRCKLVETTDAAQTATRVGRAVSGETLTIGRAASCKIYLPDPLVRLEHATITRAENGGLYLEAVGPVLVDKKSVTQVQLALGQNITLGPYEFTVTSLLDGPDTSNPSFTLAFTRRDASLEAAEVLQSQAFGLRGTRGIPGLRRITAWLLALLILLTALAIPAWQAYHPASPVPGAKHGTSGLDASWNPGPISSAHQHFSGDCKSCHAKPFERVTDASCTTCHKSTGPHAPDPHVNLQAFPDQRCASCHREHQGAAGMRVVDAVGCVQCHEKIKTFAPNASLRNVSDFATDHPPFRLSIATPQGPIRRVEQTSTLQVDSGLKFPHDVHLDKSGIKSPLATQKAGGRVVLECKNCHEKDAAGVRFEPVRMEKHCQECHRLSVDPQVPLREVPHAAPGKVFVAVRDIYASLAITQFPTPLVTQNGLLQRPANTSAATLQTDANRWVDAKASSAFDAMFQTPNGVCTTCHTIERRQADTSPWIVKPISTTTHWMPLSQFSHAQHLNAECKDCHAASASKEARDVVIPNIETCRDCHGGSHPSKEKIVSRCDSCHGFHTQLPLGKSGATASPGKAKAQ